jgi:hypothetical protein
LAEIGRKYLKKLKYGKSAEFEFVQLKSVEFRGKSMERKTTVLIKCFFVILGSLLDPAKFKLIMVSHLLLVFFIIVHQTNTL